MEEERIPAAASGKPLEGEDTGPQELEELLDHLSMLAEDESGLQSWLKRLLEHSIVADSPIVVGHEYPSDFLSSLFTSIPGVPRFSSEEGDLLQSALRLQVLKLSSKWRLPDDDFHYLLEILRAIRLLGAKKDDAPEVYGNLLSSVKNAEFRECTSSGRSLEVELIRTVFSMSKDDPEHAEIARTYIGRKELSPLCFRKLWELKDDAMLEHLTTLVGCSLAEPRIDLEGALARYSLSSESAFSDFFDAFPALLSKLLAREEIRRDVPPVDSRWMRYQSAMQNIGIDITIDRPSDLHAGLPGIQLTFAPVYTVEWHPLRRGVARKRLKKLDLGLDSSLRAEETRCEGLAAIEEKQLTYNPPDRGAAFQGNPVEYYVRIPPQIGGNGHGGS